VPDYEDVRQFTLDQERRRELLRAQNECSFVWSTREGWPVGVTMSFLWRDGRIWLTSSSQRKRVAAVRRDDRVSVIVSSAGTSLGPGKTVTIKGRCVVHDDDATKRWFLPALAAAVFPDHERRRDSFARLLDSPRRVVLEVVPTAEISHDVDRLAEASSRALAAERALSTKRPIG